MHLLCRKAFVLSVATRSSARATDSVRRHNTFNHSLSAQNSAKVAAVFTIVAFAAVLGLAIHAVANISHKVLQG